VKKNIISGCHNYTLNTTHPCTDEKLCNYYITLLECTNDELICLPQNNTMRNITNHLNVHMQECIEIDHVTPSGVHSQISSSCTTRDLVLIENTPQKISDGFEIRNENEPIFLEFSPGIPSEHSSDYSPDEDGLTRVCVSRWHSLASQPYCSYECYQKPNMAYVIKRDGDCDVDKNCTLEVRRLVLTYNPMTNNTDNRNGTDSSEGYTLSFAWKFILLLLIASLWETE